MVISRAAGQLITLSTRRTGGFFMTQWRLDTVFKRLVGNIRNYNCWVRWVPFTLEIRNKLSLRRQFTETVREHNYIESISFHTGDPEELQSLSDGCLSVSALPRAIHIRFSVRTTDVLVYDTLPNKRSLLVRCWIRGEFSCEKANDSVPGEFIDEIKNAFKRTRKTIVGN